MSLECRDATSYTYKEWSTTTFTFIFFVCEFRASIITTARSSHAEYMGAVHSVEGDTDLSYARHSTFATLVQ